MVEHRPFMYKKCEKTFEILRSEITFLMDLYYINRVDIKQCRSWSAGSIRSQLI